MKTSHWMMLTWGAGAMVALMIVMDLQSRSIDKPGPNVQESLEIAEKELGIEDSTTKDMSAAARYMRVANEAQKQVQEHQQRMQDNLKMRQDMQNLDAHQMGADTTKLHSSR